LAVIERVYLNGKVVDSSEAKVTIFDGGLLHGAGLFETMRAYDGVIFRLSDHLVRLQASGEALSLFQLDDKDVEDLAEGLRELLAANELTDARVRLTMTTGDLRPGLGGGQAAGPTVFATATVMTHYPRELYENGMTVLISRYKQSRQDPTAGCKTLGYLSRLMSLREAQAQECGEALWFTHENLLSEGAISNIFIVSGKVIKTPPVDTPVLPGVTRKAVIELATDEKISIQEIPLTINDLLSADEVFLTNSIMEIMPVCRVERHAIGDERPGALTRRIADLYRKAVIKECKLDAG
jgi:branched-chain amino acid aminotransferase